MSKVIGETILGTIQVIMVENSRGEYRNNSYRNDSYDRSRNRSRERSFSRNYDNNRPGVQAIVDQGQDLEQAQTGIE